MKIGDIVYVKSINMSATYMFTYPRAVVVIEVNQDLFSGRFLKAERLYLSLKDPNMSHPIYIKEHLSFNNSGRWGFRKIDLTVIKIKLR